MIDAEDDERELAIQLTRVCGEEAGALRAQAVVMEHAKRAFEAGHDSHAVQLRGIARELADEVAKIVQAADQIRREMRRHDEKRQDRKG